MNGNLDFGDWVKHRRNALRLSQADLAKRLGSQPSNISSIESGKRYVSDEYKNIIERELRAKPSQLLDLNRNKVLAEAAKLGISNVRVFGSVARGEDNYDSDVDFLVSLPKGNLISSTLDFIERTSDILTVDVDVVYDPGEVSGRLLSRTLISARKDAIAL